MATLGPFAFTGALCLEEGGPGTRLDGQVLGHLFRGSGQSFRPMLLAEADPAAAGIGGRPPTVPEDIATLEGETEVTFSDYTSLGIGLFSLLTDWTCATHRPCWMW